MAKNITTEAQQMTETEAQPKPLDHVAFEVFVDSVKIFNEPRAKTGKSFRASTTTVKLINGTMHQLQLCPSTTFKIDLFKEFLQAGVNAKALMTDEEFDADGQKVEVYRVIDDNFGIYVTGHVDGIFANIATVKCKLKSEL